MKNINSRFKVSPFQQDKSPFVCCQFGGKKMLISCQYTSLKHNSFFLEVKQILKSRKKSVIDFYFNDVVSKLQDVCEKHEASEN